MTVTANVTNLAAMQTAGFGTLNYNWSVSGVAVTKQESNGTLTLTRSQGSGPMTVTLAVDNGGPPVSQSITIDVQEPASDPWLQRTPGATEKPVNGQFFARDPNTGSRHGLLQRHPERHAGHRLSEGLQNSVRRQSKPSMPPTASHSSAAPMPSPRRSPQDSSLTVWFTARPPVASIRTSPPSVISSAVTPTSSRVSRMPSPSTACPTN